MATGFEAARKEAGLSVDDLYVEYRASGGTRGHRTLVRWLAEERSPGWEDYGIIASILNRALVDSGKEPALRELVSTSGDSGSSVVGRRGIEPRTYWLVDAA